MNFVEVLEYTAIHISGPNVKRKKLYMWDFLNLKLHNPSVPDIAALSAAKYRETEEIILLEDFIIIVLLMQGGEQKQVSNYFRMP